MAFLAPRILEESLDEHVERAVRHPGRDHRHRRARRCSSTRSSTPTTPAGRSTKTLVLGAVSLLLLAAFVLIELRSRLPLVPFSIFRLRTLRGADTVALLIGDVAVQHVLLHLAVPAAGAAATTR